MARYPVKRYEEEEFWPFGDWSRQLFPSLGIAQTGGISMWEEENHVVSEVSLPGIKKEEIDLSFEHSLLTICAQKKEEKEDKERKYYQKAERSFVYKLSIPGELDENAQPDASLKDGQLQIRFKKQEKKAPRTIEIRD